MAQRQIQGPEASRSSAIAFGAILNDIEYQFRLQWLDRVKYWSLQVIDARKEGVVEGQRVVAGTDMLQPYNDRRLPPGQLICVDTQNVWADPGRDDFVSRPFLRYIEPEAPPAEPVIRISPVVAIPN